MKFKESTEKLESMQLELNSLANSINGEWVVVAYLYENGILSSNESMDLMIKLRNLDNGIKNLKKSCRDPYIYSFNEPLNEKDIEPLTKELHDLVSDRIGLSDKMFELSQLLGKSN